MVCEFTRKTTSDTTISRRQERLRHDCKPGGRTADEPCILMPRSVPPDPKLGLDFCTHAEDKNRQPCSWGVRWTTSPSSVRIETTIYLRSESHWRTMATTTCSFGCRRRDASAPPPHLPSSPPGVDNNPEGAEGTVGLLGRHPQAVGQGGHQRLWSLRCPRCRACGNVRCGHGNVRWGVGVRFQWRV